MSRTEKGTSTGWRAWCRRNIPDTVRERREDEVAKVEAREIQNAIDDLDPDDDPTDLRNELEDLALPAGVTVELASVTRAGRIQSLIPAAALELEDPNDPLRDDDLEDHSDCEQCTGYPPHDDWSEHYERIGYPDGYAADLPYVVDRGRTFGKLESQEPEAPCYGCRRGLRRAAVHWPEPESQRFEHVHLMRPGVTIECTGTWWRVERLCNEIDSENEHEQAEDLPG